MRINLKKEITTYLIPFLLLCSLKSYTQENKNNLTPYKIGMLYYYGNEKNFIFDDLDYFYKTNTYKAQAYYKLGKWRSTYFDLCIQPQIQFINHKLLNKHFIRPEEENYLIKREWFTTLKAMKLYALELGLVTYKKIYKNINLKFEIGLGIAVINNNTERLSKGFTFIENANLGIDFQVTKYMNLQFGSNIGHVSNLNFNPPNSGYNTLGFIIGASYLLKR